MAHILASLEIIESNKEIAKRIAEELAKRVKVIFNKSLTQIEQEARLMIGLAIESQPEWDSLQGGVLQAELGVPEVDIRLTNILNAFLQSIKVRVHDVKVGARSFRGLISLEGLESDFQSILTLEDASYVSENAKGIQTDIPWLQWLLLEGDVTIAGYEFKTTPRKVVTKYSRTGLGLMFRRVTGRWRIPPQFAGTIQDNFITRALVQVDKKLDTIFRQSIAKNFK